MEKTIFKNSTKGKRGIKFSGAGVEENFLHKTTDGAKVQK